VKCMQTFRTEALYRENICKQGDGIKMDDWDTVYEY
jgi:hypothetical protein